MKENIVAAAEAVSMFCRLQMYIKKDLPIRSSEMGVLIYMQQQGEAVTPLMISNFFKIAKPSVTAMVNALIKNNYLLKSTSNSDGRSYSLYLTEEGRELVTSTYDEYFKTMRLLEENMGDNDFRTFIHLVQRANHILNEER